MTEKRGLALFCLLVLGWGLSRVACRRPDEPTTALRLLPNAAQSGGVEAPPPQKHLFQRPGEAAAPGAAPGGPAAAMTGPGGRSPAAIIPTELGGENGFSGGAANGGLRNPQWQTPGGGAGSSASAPAGGTTTPSVSGAPGGGAAVGPAPGAAAGVGGQTGVGGGAGAAAAREAAKRHAAESLATGAAGGFDQGNPGAGIHGGAFRPTGSAGAPPPPDGSFAGQKGVATPGTAGVDGLTKGTGGGMSSLGSFNAAASGSGAAAAGTPGGLPGGFGGGVAPSRPTISGGLHDDTTSGPAADQGPPPQIEAAQAVVGQPQLSGERQAGDVFAARPGGPQNVQTFVIRTETGKAVQFTTKMAIDNDGAGGNVGNDPYHQSATSLRYPNGASLDATKIPFIVVPLDFGRAHPDVKLGDYSAVTYGGKTVFAIVGDKGPRGVVGEGSMALAAGLGINPSPTRGGVGNGVTYTILAGSADRAPAASSSEIQTRGPQLFQKAGIPIQ